MGLAPTPSDTESAIVNCANDLLTQGQLAPVVVLCEVDFEELQERTTQALCRIHQSSVQSRVLDE